MEEWGSVMQQQGLGTGGRVCGALPGFEQRARDAHLQSPWLPLTIVRCRGWYFLLFKKLRRLFHLHDGPTERAASSSPFSPGCQSQAGCLSPWHPSSFPVPLVPCLRQAFNKHVTKRHLTPVC